MNFNSTIRKPVNDLHNIGWFTDSQPTQTITEKSSLQNVEEEINHDEQRSPSPQFHNHRESNTYASNDFDDNDNATDNSQ